jgi:hypothetical protein
MRSPAHKFFALVAVGLIGFVALAQAQSKPNFSGSWKVNNSKSDFGPMPAPQSITSKIDHKEPNLKIATTWVGDQGERTFEFSYTTDGKENTNTFGNAEIKSKATWEGSTLLIASKGSADSGEFSIQDKMSLSEDGRTFTLVRAFSGPMGEATQTLIHDKQ